jgi:hypothetical protein
MFHKLVLKSLPGTNTLAYYENEKITDKNSFIILSPGPNVIKLFPSVIYECLQLAEVFVPSSLV